MVKMNDIERIAQTTGLDIEGVSLQMCIFCETFDYPEYDDMLAVDDYIKAMCIYGVLYG